MSFFPKLILILLGSTAPPDSPAEDFLLLESGDFFLLETSDKLILE